MITTIEKMRYSKGDHIKNPNDERVWEIVGFAKVNDIRKFREGVNSNINNMPLETDTLMEWNKTEFDFDTTSRHNKKLEFKTLKWGVIYKQIPGVKYKFTAQENQCWWEEFSEKTEKVNHDND